MSFAAQTGAQVIAEGIENQAELEAVRALGIPYGQGYFIAHPSPVEQMPQHYPHLGWHTATQASR